MSEFSTETSANRPQTPAKPPKEPSENNTRPLLYALLGASAVLMVGWITFLGWAVMRLFHA